MKTATIGFRAKTGRAIAIGLSGEAFVLRHEFDLTDPRVPETAQPFHAVMELPWREAIKTAAPFVAAIEAVAAERLASLLQEIASRGFTIKRVGIVGSQDRDLVRLGNPHIRAHAAEGILFRRVLEVAAATHGLQATSFTEQEARDSAPAALLNAIGKEAGKPWRTDEKAAATAAWLARR